LAAQFLGSGCLILGLDRVGERAAADASSLKAVATPTTLVPAMA
jgi:hypothetical protein